jgi:hypothetical protein
VKSQRETGRDGVMFEVRKHLGTKPDLVLFRNQAGFIDRGGGRAERYGLAPGASDLIGVGPGGRFFALEIKAPKKVPTPEQQTFIELIRKLGGFADYADSVKRAEDCYLAAKFGRNQL